MKNYLKWVGVLGLGVVAGSVATSVIAQPESIKPAFIIVSSDPSPNADPEALRAYTEAAGPLAREAGIQMLARGEVTVLEGEWPYGGIAVERFDSMEALLGFWYSDGYQAAKKLREGQSIVHFIVAVEGI